MSRGDVERLYSKFAPVVFRLARKVVSRDVDAWDVVQEVFERMLSQAGTFRNEARPMTWVYRVTTNVSLNHLRKRKLREPAFAVVTEEAVGMEQVEARQWLGKWVACLTEREQEVATLVYVDGLTQAEVADVLQLSRKTIGRDVEALRAKLSAFDALPVEVET